MKIVAITGVGPRTGTSFVMKKLSEAGVTIAWTPAFEAVLPAEGAPDGYFEVDIEALREGGPDGVVAAKVWPIHLKDVEVDRMVVLRRRDREAHKGSVALQIHREVMAGLLHDETLDPDDVIAESESALTDELRRRNIRHVEFITEDLDGCIDEIISYVRGVN